MGDEKAASEVGERAAWTNALSSWLARTSLHGAPLVWLLLTLFGLTMATVQISQRIRYYYSNPVSVDIESSHRRRMPFPAVTICNQNWLSCSWHGKHNNCGARQFKRTFTDYGLCYTFNHYMRTPLVSELSGSKYGLQLVLNVEQYEYVRGPEITAGVKVLAHHQRQPAMMQNSGVYVPVGFKADVDLRLKTRTNVPPPHGRCGDKTLTFYRSYSKATCEMDCVYQYMMDLCHCRDVYLPETSPGFPALCSLKMWLMCALQVPEYYHYTGRLCQCPQACHSSHFDASVTYSKLSYKSAPNVVGGHPGKYREARHRFLQSLNTHERVHPSRVRRTREITDQVTLALQGLKDSLDNSFQRVQKTVARFDEIFLGLDHQVQVLVQVTRILKAAYQTYIVDESVDPCSRLVDMGTISLVAIGKYEIHERLSAR
ncbi:acid-sensing ion channel 5-like [Pollicipes pollicipes]|uniref:acid-sensing ion channel 5-like n=1 Tax=Pollicipes pollicipes TaxID=41117 RepID=UPI001884A510|nr:acid-sensing ion channel 5-like [Pollicipes pollicipes]